MDELGKLKRELAPAEILFVADAMIGQDAVRSAGEFHRRLGLTGVVLTKLDGDARGGAALSIGKVTGAPVKFVGMGEKYDALEAFYPGAHRLARAGHGRRAVADRARRADHRPQAGRRARTQAAPQRIHARGFPRPVAAGPQDGAARAGAGHAAEDRPAGEYSARTCRWTNRA